MSGHDYRPASDFLMRAVKDEVPFTEGAGAAANVARLIALTRDPDRSNRDWAVLLLGQTGLETAAVNAALRAALDDPDEDVRMEALVAVAQREPALALPLVAAALEGESVHVLAPQAAAYVADRALLPALEDIWDEFGDEGDLFTDHLREAMACCATGVAPDWR